MNWMNWIANSLSCRPISSWLLPEVKAGMPDEMCAVNERG
jgi:hypothetical protein